MKFNVFFLSLLALALTFTACNNDDDDDDPKPESEQPITEQNVRAVFNFLPPSGYDTDMYVEDLPASVTAIYRDTDTGQTITVAATENLSGDVIDVTDFTIESSFFMPDNIAESTVNGTMVYQAMEPSSYRAVIFRGQYRFDVQVNNDPDPAVAEAEAGRFVELITEAMTTF